jgi:hypothetical protein
VKRHLAENIYDYLGKYMGILTNRKYVRNKKINENKLVGGTTA